jgi:hypothetical protein
LTALLPRLALATGKVVDEEAVLPPSEARSILRPHHPHGHEQHPQFRRLLPASGFDSVQRILAEVAIVEPDRQVLWVMKDSAAVRLPLSLIASRVEPLLKADGDTMWVFDEESANGILVDLSEDSETPAADLKWMLEVVVWGEDWAARASLAA